MAEAIVKNNGGTEIARGAIPVLDADLRNVRSQEASEIEYLLTGDITIGKATFKKGQKVTLDQLKQAGAKDIILDFGDGPPATKPFADFARYAQDAGVKEPKTFRRVRITVPGNKTALTKQFGAKHEILKKAGQVLTLEIALPADRDWTTLPADFASRLISALETAGYSTELIDALKQCGTIADLNPEIELGFAKTDMLGVVRDLEAKDHESETPEENSDRHGKVDDYMKAQGWQGPSVAESLKKADEAMRMVRKLLSLLLELIDFLITRIASGDIDALAMSNDIDAAIGKLMASKTGLFSAKEKRKINERLTQLAQKKIEALRKAREAYGRKDQAGYAKHQEAADVAENEINAITPLRGMLDNLVETFLEAARAAAKQAESIRFKADQANNTRFG